MVINKKAVSEIVGTVIVIAIVIGIGTITWVVVNNFVKQQTEEAGSCIEIIDKVSLEGRYTCYNITSRELQFSINIGDIDVDEILVGISGQGKGISFTIKKQPEFVQNVVMYPDRDPNVKLPERNAGLTYLFNFSSAGFTEVPDSIKISPSIKKNRCGVVDSINEIENCALIVQ
ncbi:MAG: archaellin/type IV pilin N-terminal domain-containing protein [Candidatus Pacearchaeota archaeon]